MRALVRGTGSIGARHLRVLESMGVDELYAWPVRKGTGSTERADIPSRTVFVDTYPNAPLDLIIIATDTVRHVDDALGAVEQNPRSVLLEKPVAPTVQQCRPLLDHPRASIVSVSAPLRFHDGYVELAQLLEQEGTPTSAQIVSQSWLPSWRPGRDYRQSYSARSDEGGALRDLVHDIDYPLALLGTPDTVVARLGRGVLGIEAEESADLLWHSSGKEHPLAVSVRLDYVSPVKKREIRIATAHSALSWNVVTNSVIVERPGSVPELSVHPGDGDVDNVLARQSGTLLQRVGVVVDGLRHEYNAASLQAGVLAVAVCDAARLSDRTRRGETVVL
ncbi:putative dehydrogenase [Arthrobacter pigmenti]|uniref:Putative dehydrogenase n=1 Tax=Arthrobacter pigmenti TaxID=271432 RepID=A0A846RRX4_9MICC|nr:putative dehydrogenase [Arthrobacter pigmenti]